MTELDDLIQRALDGDLDDAERETLREWLARDPEAARRFDDLCRVTTTLERMPAEPVPEGFRESVLARTVAGRKKNVKVFPTLPDSRSTYGRGEREAVPMKSRKFAFIAAAAAIVGVVSLVYFQGSRPEVDANQAVGAIGAVEKYRAPQITEQDVALGGIETDDTIPFSDFISESGDAENFSREIDGFAAKIAKLDAKSAQDELGRMIRALDAKMSSLDAKSQAAISLQAKQLADELGRMKRTLDAQAQDLERRRSLDARAQDLERRRTLDAKTLESMRLEASKLADDLGAKKIDVNEARKRLDAITQELGRARTLDAQSQDLERRRLDAKRLESASADLDANARELGRATQLDAKRLESAAADLDAITRELGRASQLDAKRLESARAGLEAIHQSLEQRKLDLGMKRLESRREYLDAAAAHSSALTGARAELAAMQRELGASTRALDAKKVTDLGMKMLDNARALESKGLLGMRNQLEAKVLEAKTLLGMKNALDLAAKSELGAKDLKDSLGRISKTLDASTLEAASRLGANAAADLGACQRLLGAKNATLNAATLDAMKGYLGAANQALEAQRQLGAASKLESFAGQLGAVSDALQARSQKMD